ncbi:urea transporter 1 [Cynoglossus semilaevis]|uniref:Urea transporter n=1 Tax=Cynoglossus semilaevis TaxID=244447 RepID=A0A3P8WE98_CYNSE|nr:urea transporter 1-like [Cynoglossus semilaevis]
MWMEYKPDTEEVCNNPPSLSSRVYKTVLLFTGDMEYMDKYMQDKPYLLQLAVCCFRGVSRVSLANNPLSGALILAALYWDSPWQGLLGTLGTLVSTLTAVVIGQDSAEVLGGLHAYNGTLVSLLIGVFNSAGDWYWLLLLPVCFSSVSCVFLQSGLSSLLAHWDLSSSVYPFNIVLLLYLLCTGPDNPYFPHYQVLPPGGLDVNDTNVIALEMIRAVPLGVGQIFACATLGPSFLIFGAVVLYSPLLAAHAMLGSAIGLLAGLSVAVRHDHLYSGLSGLNGALGCMVVGGLFFTLNWRTHLFAVASAFFASYFDIALGNLLGTVGLPSSSVAATFTVTLMSLLTGTLAQHRIPPSQVSSPELNLLCRSKWKITRTSEEECTAQFSPSAQITLPNL